jgi:hypothetical protein
VDPELVTFAATLKVLGDSGVTAERYSLSVNPSAFTDNLMVLNRLRNEGTEILPLTLVDGAVLRTGSYPSREELEKALRSEVSR